MAPPRQGSPTPSQLSGKSEVSDLKSELRQLAGSRAPSADDAKRSLFKKVISNMTIGIDVSALFGEMVMCSATSDIVLKKMCYLYVGNYAKVNLDLALLTINFHTLPFDYSGNSLSFTIIPDYTAPYELYRTLGEYQSLKEKGD